jgi:hypothetical protein
MGLSMMLIFCDIPRFTRIGSNIFPTKIPILNTYWAFQALDVNLRKMIKFFDELLIEEEKKVLK